MGAELGRLRMQRGFLFWQLGRRDDALEPQDELLFIAARTMEDNLENLLSPGHLPRGKDEDDDDE